MDRGQGSEDIWRRTQSIEALGSTGLNDHMRGTLGLLRALLRIEVPQVWRHFAMTNTAKCCYSGPGMDSVKPALYRNRARYAVDELDILRPDLVVTQGDNARLFTAGRKQVLPGDLAEEALNRADCNTTEARSLLHRRVKILSLDRTYTILLESVHPSARHHWYRFRDQDLPLLVRVVRYLIDAT
jgi:uracil-DNA glycosylase